MTADIRRLITLVETADREQLSQFLYHGTSLSNLVGIAEADMLAANNADSQVGLTRNPAVAKRFASGWAQQNTAMNQGFCFSDFMVIDIDIPGIAARAEAASGKQGGILVLDRAKLMANHAVVPFLDQGDEAYAHEEEEAVDQDIHSLSRYLARIIAPGMDVYAQAVMADTTATDDDRGLVGKALAYVNRFA